MKSRGDFAHVVKADFEFIAGNGRRPDVVCVAFKIDDAPTRVHWRDDNGVWTDEDGNILPDKPPYPTGNDTLFVSFTQAEPTCHLGLDWPLPAHVLDLNCELRFLTAGFKLKSHGLLGFCEVFGVPAGDATVKDVTRNIILHGRPYTAEEQIKIIKYGGSDTDATSDLFDRVLPYVNFERGLYRGEFSKVSAKMEHRGVSMNAPLRRELGEHWTEVRDALVPELDQHGVYVQDDKGEWHFSSEQFERLLTDLGMLAAWPRTETGRLSLTSKVFHDLTKGVPSLENLRQLKHMREQMRTVGLPVGPDDRSRTPLWPYQSKTGRTQPSASEFPFSPATWLRNLIAPAPGKAICYVDWSSMEFLVAAVNSNDPLMLKFYYDGDPYISFGVHVGTIPKGATKTSHRQLRDLYKTGLISIQYCVSPTTLGARLGISEIAAREMIRQHRALFHVYWAWADDWVNWALNHGIMWTAIDWRCAVNDSEPKARGLVNWPTQATGGDILRLSCIWADRHGIDLCAPVHDALLIEAPLERIEHDVALMKEIMRRASRVVLGGHELRTSAEIIRYPDHFTDPRGDEIWAHVMTQLERFRGSAA